MRLMVLQAYLPAVLPDGASAPAGQRISGGQRTGLLLPRRQ